MSFEHSIDLRTLLLKTGTRLAQGIDEDTRVTELLEQIY